MAEALDKIPQDKRARLLEIRNLVLEGKETPELIFEGLQLLQTCYNDRYTVTEAVAKTKTSRTRAPKQVANFSDLLADIGL